MQICYNVETQEPLKHLSVSRQAGAVALGNVPDDAIGTHSLSLRIQYTCWDPNSLGSTIDPDQRKAADWVAWHSQISTVTVYSCRFVSISDQRLLNTCRYQTTRREFSIAKALGWFLWPKRSLTPLSTASSSRREKGRTPYSAMRIMLRGRLRVWRKFGFAFSDNSRLVVWFVDAFDCSKAIWMLSTQPKIERQSWKEESVCNLSQQGTGGATRFRKPCPHFPQQIQSAQVWRFAHIWLRTFSITPGKTVKLMEWINGDKIVINNDRRLLFWSFLQYCR